MITIMILYVLIHYLMYLSIYENHFGNLSVGFSGVVFSMSPIARSIIEKEKKSPVRKNLANNRRSSPSPILTFGKPYTEFVLTPYIEWILLVVTSIVTPKRFFFAPLAGDYRGALICFFVRKNRIPVS